MMNEYYVFATLRSLLTTFIKKAFADIFSQGYSRVPVYEPQAPPNESRITAMKGILMTRQLSKSLNVQRKTLLSTLLYIHGVLSSTVMVDWEDERTVSTLPLYIPPCVSPRMNLVTLLHLLRKGGSLIAFVCAGK